MEDQCALPHNLTTTRGFPITCAYVPSDYGMFSGGRLVFSILMIHAGVAVRLRPGRKARKAGRFGNPVIITHHTRLDPDPYFLQRMAGNAFNSIPR